MFKIIKYSLKDLSRSRWSIAYTMFYALLGFSVLFLNSDTDSAITTLMNVVLMLSPLVGTVFGVIYYYNQSEFIQILLSQPIDRRKIILGQYLGLSLSLSSSFTVGLSIPFLVYGMTSSLLTLIVLGVLLHLIFSGLAYSISLSTNNKVKGFGLSILLWLLFAVVYDGVVLGMLVFLSDYPLEGITIMLSCINPIDLARTVMMMSLDAAALMGYTGAVFQKFFTSSTGIIVAFATLTLWALMPAGLILTKLKNKDF